MNRTIGLRLLGVVIPLLLAGCTSADHEKALWFKDQGDFYYQNGKWDQAHAEYGAAIGKDEDFIEAYIALAYTCRMQGKVEYIKSPNEYGRRVAEKRYQEAHWWTELCLEKEEGNPEAFHLQGLLWYDACKFEQAIDSFDKVLDHDPHHKHANKYKSMCLFMQGVKLRGEGAAAKEKAAKLRVEGEENEANLEMSKQVDLYRDAVEKYEVAAKTMEAYLTNWDKLEVDKPPQEADLRNWIRVLREMAKSDGTETEEARIYMNKIKNVAPALTEKGAAEGAEGGQPVIRESDLVPSMMGKDSGAANQPK
ncbi:MAG: tetratricopeptide repeat protein [Planctomycetota bacterium]